MSSVTQAKATLDDFQRLEGKAELISGRIVHLMPSGHKPGTSTPRPDLSGLIGRRHRIGRPCSASARSLMPSPRSPDGASPSTTSLRE
jgi:hypothetical protein